MIGLPTGVKFGWAAFTGFLGSVPRLVWYALAAAAVLLYARSHWIGVGEDRCEAKWAVAQQKANAAQATREARWRKVSAAVTTETKTKADAAVARTEGNTHAREVQIIRVPVTGRCAPPVGLPNLAPAVDAANAANG